MAAVRGAVAPEAAAMAVVVWVVVAKEEGEEAREGAVMAEAASAVLPGMHAVTHLPRSKSERLEKGCSLSSGTPCTHPLILA